ncbi:hypothetical protein PILCRDRAFT_811362 [Piloderma croceum F 1598]|uniref:Uncharacterized protein n=1 Tax=Piloderma croceum (strain F 1598) TaxID=765440 RepID=A0A0C3CMH6_PILCF|nr:hypothetical protein PILCRDRAFT_811362 [Piloderma croceum F 1598]
MSRRQPLRRDMSYRKPVPKYVPSPPPSPRPAPLKTPYNRQSLSMESTIMYNEMPPLPSGWRHAIERATCKDRQPFGSVMPDVDDTNGSRASSVCGACRREQVSSSWMNDGSDNHSISDHSDRPLGLPASPRSGAQSPRTNRKRTLPLDYRPPTPPLPAYVKEDRLDGQTAALPSMNYHMIYPDPPSVLDLDWILPRNIIDERISNASRPELIPSASSQTETTQSFSLRSSSSTRVNAPISDTREIWDTWCIIPVLPNDHKSPRDRVFEEKEWRSFEGSNQARRFWERLAMLGNLLRERFRSFRAVPFSNCDCDSPISST